MDPLGVKTDRIDDHIGALDRRGSASLVEQVSGLVTQFRPLFGEHPFGAPGMSGDDPHREPLRSQMRHDVVAEKPRAPENSNSRRAHRGALSLLAQARPSFLVLRLGDFRVCLGSLRVAFTLRRIAVLARRLTLSGMPKLARAFVQVHSFCPTKIIFRNARRVRLFLQQRERSTGACRLRTISPRSFATRMESAALPPAIHERETDTKGAGSHPGGGLTLQSGCPSGSAFQNMILSK